MEWDQLLRAFHTTTKAGLKTPSRTRNEKLLHPSQQYIPFKGKWGGGGRKKEFVEYPAR